jgi:hypothetical protein
MKKTIVDKIKISLFLVDTYQTRHKLLQKKENEQNMELLGKSSLTKY